MKLDHLLSQFLYQHKQLVLPGIGTFTLDASVVVPSDSDKYRTPANGIHFSNKSTPNFDPELVKYIHVHTGKMMPLAQSDLESYISLGHQFLNIGKPLYIEGIGTLVKVNSGLFEFSPGEFVTQKLEDNRDANRRSAFDDETKHEPESNSMRNVFLAAAILGTLALVAWGAWYLYQKNVSASESPAVEQVVADSIITLPPDSAALQAYAPDSSLLKKDSIVPTTSAAPGTYKFILETANKKRAFRRYAQLKEFENKIQMETADSITFKLYFELMALPTDTTRIRDSLSRYYQNKVRVE